MIFGRPLPFSEALDANLARALLPTDFLTSELADLEPGLLRRCLFSAQVTDIGDLQSLQDIVQDTLSGTVDVATGRLRQKQWLKQRGYVPESGFAGSLQDLGSDQRINLQIQTNVEMMQGLGNHLQGMQADVLDAYPAQELVRVTNWDAVDHGTARDWALRWADAGGSFFGSRMIALKTDPIWTRISRFKNPYPPFDFQSGMGLRDIGRREAMRLGIIDLNTKLTPDQTGRELLTQNLETRAAAEDPRLRTALEETGLGRFDSDGVYRYIEEVAA